ncbi:2-methoxy-6-polyprenyl-1,4-benzoquinol methylase, mitochondrial isoform X2 [Microcaecilia unicolor]|uniref:2-methoxy-6-polyprenyl-1,4-benzoquinol methylase, mitochondrial n=1 Tax=Microcaecilia unicolor TaxID=1415580 RepID=A0A6P7Z7W5_9AMPH|nr:2-methoxy-6-polyprenyl-1,4-benzoquinol methylase, mitochondrial isoform X2 [Microcaecilia unicolor]
MAVVANRRCVVGLCRRLCGITAMRWFTRFQHTDRQRVETHFGFEPVSEAEKKEKVQQVFDNVALKYDIMNDFMTLGIHRLWKDSLLRLMKPYPGTRLLDVAGGTGDIAFLFLDYIYSQREIQMRRELKSWQNLSWLEISKSYQETGQDLLGGSHAVICDINQKMMAFGEKKARQLGYTKGLSWVVGNAEELPFFDDNFDIYTVGFGIRNMTNIKQALQEAYRVLKPGGRFLCLEFSQVNNPLISSFQVIPVLGEVIVGDWKSYQYLVESIRLFPAQEEFKAMIEDAGFMKVNYHNLASGIAAIHSGFKL